jgi:aryl-alcohol dehydrogenase-like predicted oxidoreductase
MSSRFAQKLAQKLERPLSRVAFGAARLGERRALAPGSTTSNIEDIPSIPALQHALSIGINVIDTSTIYGKDGASEIEIGKIIQCIDRNDVVLVSKCGYKVEVENEGKRAEEMIQNKMHTSEALDLFSSPIQVSDHVWSCFSPSFIRDELTRSLERMQVSTLDAYLLHNPEHYLEHHLPLDGTLDTNTISNRREKFINDVILPAFIELENEVINGRILSYGISSKCFNHSRTHPHYFDSEKLFATAKEAVDNVMAAKGSGSSSSNNGGVKTSTQNHQHNFDIIQVPMNPFEAHGIDMVNNLQEKHRMHVMLNRPLSPVDRLGVWRLVDGGRTFVCNSKDQKLPKNSMHSGDIEFSDPLLAEWETLPEVIAMRAARDAAFTHFTPPAPENVDKPTADEMEIIEACIFLCSLIRDIDREIDQFTSFQHYEQNILEGIIPVIHDKIEGMDEDSTKVLMKFFEQYGKAVRCVVPFVTRSRMKSILNPLANLLDAESKQKDSLDNLGNASFNLCETPHDISDDMSLEEYSLKWINQINCGNIIVGMTTDNHVNFAAKHIK